MSELTPMTAAEFEDSIISSVVHKNVRDRIALALREREQLLEICNELAIMLPFHKDKPDTAWTSVSLGTCRRAAQLLKGGQP